MLKALDRKLLRDLYQLKGQALAIALVIGCGVATFVMSLSALQSLQRTREAYYERYRFADVFARLKRAPQALAPRIAALPGVAQVQTRVVMDVTLDLPTLPEPAIGRLISLPDQPHTALNGIYLRAGRLPERGRGEEVLVGEAFARVHALQPGDRVTAILNGRKQALRIVGIALSPEYILQIREGELLPDEKRFGIFWMAREELAAAFNMEEAFNSVTLTLLRGASQAEVLDRLDRLTAPYGGIGAYGRDDQLSHRYLSDEMRQLRGMGTVAPTIFLSVSAFLLNVVLSRIIRTQREQIAALKAFGYTNWAVGRHYLKLVLLITVLGSSLGLLAGAYLGRGLTEMYTRFYRFPVFHFSLDLRFALGGLAISSLAAIVGTLLAIRGAVRLPPAEAMRPEPPATYRPTLLERSGLGILLSPAARIVIRNLERRPLKALFSSLGIALAVAVLILGSFSEDALDYIIQFQFYLSQRYDMNVAFVEPAGPEVLYAVGHLPGVMRAEPYRAVATRMRFGHHARRVGLLGLPPDRQLFQLVDHHEQPVALPREGVMLSSKLAELLQVGLHDQLTVEVLEGHRQTARLPVTALVTEFGGTNAYIDIRALRRLLREDQTVSGVFLQVDQQQAGPLYRTLKETPRVAAVGVKQASLASFQQTVAENLGRLRIFNVIFASIIALGVVYNNARISLSERSRELATLRVIGFTRNEISGILLGELAVLTLTALPLGMLLGYGLAAWATTRLDTEIYRIPLVVDPSTYAFAVSVVLLATVLSALSVRRQLNQLDLLAVLKTKE